MNHSSIEKRLWQLAWPMVLTNLTVPLLGLVDTAVLGHLERPQYLGAVAIGANLFSLLYWTFGFMRMGTTGLAAQAYGQQDRSAQAALLLRSLLIALGISALLILLQTPLIKIGLYLMGASETVTLLAAEYAHIRIWSAPAVLLQYTLVGWLIGVHYSRGPLIMLLVANLLNIVLDIYFVSVLGWNSRGVAVATVLAEYTAAVLGLWLAWRRLPEFHQDWRKLLGTLHDYLKILNVNRYIMVRTVLLLLVFAFFTAQGARMGDTVLAANAVLLTFLLLLSHGLDGFANAAEALVGEAVGAKQRQYFIKICRIVFLWSFWGALLFTALFLFGGHWLIQLLTSIPEVQASAQRYLPWLWLMPMVAVWGYTLDGIFIGAMRTRAMQNTMIFATLGVFFPAWWLTQAWGNHGLWLAVVLLMLARDVSMGGVLWHTWRHGHWFTADSAKLSE